MKDSEEIEREFFEIVDDGNKEAIKTIIGYFIDNLNSHVLNAVYNGIKEELEQE